ncbi:hypothetical protein C9E85_13955 [Plesiomonas shigelloides]|uniref:hypothetical protein n=1 Tax=Plesiomonas shigelloides TaxID=703 RepID=UPI000D57AE94|nr:hypothetical protein [Plesiomonas shigelloides]MBW3794424.1 hypothetical protein [Plesiomonas shigelloides]PVU65252.1 hypothetical protein C9E85_13955 [Plesiomonas shigelloides]
MIGRVLVILLTFFSCVANAKFSPYIGYWSVNCGGFGGYVIVSDMGEARVNVNDNNLLISAKLRELTKNSSELFFIDILESRNEKIDWSSISLDKPIAKLTENDGVLVVNWFGFFDMKKKEYVWNTQPDFIVDTKNNKNTIMKKCIF